MGVIVDLVNGQAISVALDGHLANISYRVYCIQCSLLFATVKITSSYIYTQLYLEIVNVIDEWNKTWWIMIQLSCLLCHCSDLQNWLILMIIWCWTVKIFCQLFVKRMLACWVLKWLTVEWYPFSADTVECWQLACGCGNGLDLGEPCRWTELLICNTDCTCLV